MHFYKDRLKKAPLLPISLGLLALFIGWLWYPGAPRQSPQKQDGLQVAIRWNRFLLELDRFSEGQRPPVSARLFAYVGLTAWESSLPAEPECRSLEGYCNGLHIPKWEGKSADFNLPAALNAAYFEITRRFFPHASKLNAIRTEQLSKTILSELQENYPSESLLPSAQYGKMVAEAVYQWSTTDKIGHQAYLFNYDRNYPIPDSLGVWRSDEERSMVGLLPHWGGSRPFVVPVNSIEPVPPAPFSQEHNSAFFTQALEVYTITTPLSEEKRWVAEFWSDDFPGVTFSTSSRWISIATQAIEKAKPDFAKAMAVYLKVGLALQDVGINVWKIKYQYLVERPDTYIRRNINPEWKPLHGTPPFPSYPSGHSGFAAAAAAVLTAELGEDFALTDRSHEGRKEFNGNPRNFASFANMAKEDAYSRIPMGVHYRMDCDEGLRLGRIIGEKVNGISLIQSEKIVRNGR